MNGRHQRSWGTVGQADGRRFAADHSGSDSSTETKNAFLQTNGHGRPSRSYPRRWVKRNHDHGCEPLLYRSKVVRPHNINRATEISLADGANSAPSAVGGSAPKILTAIALTVVYKEDPRAAEPALARSLSA